MSAERVSRIAPTGWMTAAPTQAVLKALGAGGATVRFVGGCVRDAILGLTPQDIDIATPELPETVIRRLQKAKIKAVPTGIEHGTVTAVAPPASFQITTLRRDVATDGRHAEVAFGTDWAEDAARRDFTINTLYADADGTLHDFTGGRDDLAAGIVRFVGDPAQRVAEDYLRVLRFFRFHARFGKGAPDPVSLAACAAATDQLHRLSGERVRDELLKILVLPKAGATLALMAASGVLPALLPGSRFDPEVFAALAALQESLSGETGMEPSVWPRLAMLYPSDGGAAEAVADRLRLSNAQRLRLAALMEAPMADEVLQDDARFLETLYAWGGERTCEAALLLGARKPSLADISLRRAREALAWQRPAFPLRGADILALGIAPGPTVSALLKEMEAWWVADGFRADREACLARLKERVRIVSGA